MSVAKRSARRGSACSVFCIEIVTQNRHWSHRMKDSATKMPGLSCPVGTLLRRTLRAAVHTFPLNERLQIRHVPTRARALGRPPNPPKACSTLGCIPMSPWPPESPRRVVRSGAYPRAPPVQSLTLTGRLHSSGPRERGIRVTFPAPHTLPAVIPSDEPLTEPLDTGRHRASCSSDVKVRVAAQGEQLVWLVEQGKRLV